MNMIIGLWMYRMVVEVMVVVVVVVVVYNGV
jgi:hypothetical protein